MNIKVRARAPLRISFGGGGTDVNPYVDKYGGAVISTTIDKYAYVSIKKSKQNLVVTSQDYNIRSSIGKNGVIKHEKLRLIGAALDYLGIADKNLDINILVDAVPGSGLGSSSSVVVALIGGLYRYLNKPYSSYDIADASYKIERIKCNIKGGLQDQYSSAFGGFNFIEFNKSSVIVNPLRIRDEILDELLSCLLLVDTTQRRVGDMYDKIMEKQINQSLNKKTDSIENLHFIKKIAYEMKDLLLKGDLHLFGEKLHSSWLHKKKIDVNISNPFIDKLYAVAIEAGATGGKLLGAGGGGYLLFFCPLEKKNNVIKRITLAGGIITSFNFDFRGLRTWMLMDNKVIY
jgi:D-glycero-alpha-D-manno-heptose-7-phosphate kinase